MIQKVSLKQSYIIVFNILTAMTAFLFYLLPGLGVSAYFAFGKRRGEYTGQEIQKEENSVTRPVLEKYNYEFLTGEMYLFMGLGIVFYTLWTVEKSGYLVYTVPFVLVICMVYNLEVSSSSDGDPMETLVSNKALAFLMLVYVSIIFVAVYCYG